MSVAHGQRKVKSAPKAGIPISLVFVDTDYVWSMIIIVNKPEGEMNLWPEKNNSRLLVLLTVFLVVLVIASGTGYYYFFVRNANVKTTTAENVLATVGDVKITTTDLTDRSYCYGFIDNQPLSKSIKSSLLDDLVQRSIYQQAANRLSISTTTAELDSDIKANVTANLSTYSARQKKCVTDASTARVLKTKVDNKVVTSFSGDALIIRYNKYFPDILNGTDAQTTALKAAVKPVADDIYSRVKAGTLSFAAATKEIQTNPTIDVKAYIPSGNYGDEYLSLNNASQITTYPNVLTNVEAMKEKEVKIFSVSFPTANPEKPDKLIYKDAAYLIIRLNSYKKGEAKSVGEWIKSQKSTLKVGVYYEKIK